MNKVDQNYVILKYKNRLMNKEKNNEIVIFLFIFFNYKLIK